MEEQKKIHELAISSLVAQFDRKAISQHEAIRDAVQAERERGVSLLKEQAAFNDEV